jgi:aminoglycoside phosphotransferase family enzyme
MASETDVRKTKLPPYVQAMLSESFYAKTPTRAPRLVQTHISYVVLTGHTAYKIKKDVNMGFLDFSTLELRKLYCEREVWVNPLFLAYCVI